MNKGLRMYQRCALILIETTYNDTLILNILNESHCYISLIFALRYATKDVFIFSIALLVFMIF